MVVNSVKVPCFSAAQLQDYFKPASWLLKFDFIHHLVRFNNVMMAVIDEPGSGKTTFCKLLQNHFNEQIKVSYFSDLNPVDVVVAKNDLLAQMSDIIGQPLENCNTLESMVELINQSEMHHLIVIDNAEQLSQDFIVSLIRAMKSQKSTAFFHLCLAGDQGLAKMLSILERHDEFKDCIHAFEPGTLKLNEVKTYVRRKLMSKPDAIKQIVADDQSIEEFYKLTAGHMAMINKNLDFFKPKYQASYKNASILGMLLMVFGGAYFLGSYHSRSSDPSQNNIAGQLSQDFKRDQADMKLATLPADNEYTMQMASSSQRILPASFEPQSRNRGAVNMQAEKTRLPAFAAARKKATELLQVVAVTKGRQVAIETGIFRMEQDSVLPKRTLRSSLSANKQPISQQVKSPLKMTMSSHDRKNVIRHGMSSGRVMQRTVRQDGYTIQLIASKKREDIERFIMQHQLQNDVAMKFSNRDGERWYVLTYGRYQSARQAALAIRHLPKSTASASPWVRKERDLSVVG